MGHCHCVVVQAALGSNIEYSAIVGLSNDRNIPELTWNYKEKVMSLALSDTNRARHEDIATSM